MKYDNKLIINDLKVKGFHIAKGLIPLNKFEIARKESISFFEKQKLKNKKLPKALRGGVKAGMKNNFGYSSNKAWKIFRLCAFTWNRKESELNNVISLSRELSSFRNRIVGAPDDYGLYIENNGFIQYTSLSLYPPNGGFLNKHRDAHAVKDGKPLVHFKLELTHKNIDYEEGGFYIWDRKNQEHCISDLVKPGDVIFFDGTLYHEIKPINGVKGRIALFEIPTYVMASSRNSDYYGDGEKLSLKAKFKNKIKKFLKQMSN